MNTATKATRTAITRASIPPGIDICAIGDPYDLLSDSDYEALSAPSPGEAPFVIQVLPSGVQVITLIVGGEGMLFDQEGGQYRIVYRPDLRTGLSLLVVVLLPNKIPVPWRVIDACTSNRAKLHNFGFFGPREAWVWGGVLRIGKLEIKLPPTPFDRCNGWA